MECSRCLLPDHYINIEFDAEGVCNYCRNYDKVSDKLSDYDHLQKLLIDRIELMKGKGEYDAVVGFSGGKDSCYVAHQLKKKYDLKVLLVTYDNGFFSEFAKKSVDSTVAKLGFDHLWVRPDAEMVESIYKNSLKRFGVPCIGCTFFGMLTVLKVAVDKRVPFVFHGRSRAQMFKELIPKSSDPFFQFWMTNLNDYDIDYNREYMSDSIVELNKTLKKLIPSRKLRERGKSLFGIDPESVRKMDYAPEAIAYFLFEAYDEEKLVNVLEDDLGWSKMKGADILGHQDCKIHGVASYLYNKVCTYPLLTQELSTMVREGDFSKEAATERLSLEENLYRYDSIAMSELSNGTKMSEKQILRSASAGRAGYSFYKFLMRFIPYNKRGQQLYKDTFDW